MGNLLNYDGIKKYWQDDYYFCEDKILANVSAYFNQGHELMFAGGFNFGYETEAARDKRIGDRITVKYFNQREYLRNYHGVHICRYDKTFGADAFLHILRKELDQGRPAAVGLKNCGVWQSKPGEEEVTLLPFLVIGWEEDGSIRLIDSHELGITRKITKEVFRDSYRWGVTFEKMEEVQNIIDTDAFIKDILSHYGQSVSARHGCVDVDLSFSSISSDKDMFALRQVENPYGEMLRLSEDILKMDFEKEVGNLESVLWVPFYFDLLLLYRSRLVFTKALKEVDKRNHTDLFGSIIKRLVVSSSKWNYLRMMFTNCYHKGEMPYQVKETMSNEIREIAEHEKTILEELRKLTTVSYDTLKISDQYNTYTFDHPNWRMIGEDKTVYGRYFYRGQTPSFLNATEKGDSIVCLGQTLKLEDTMSGKRYRKLILCGSVLYNEMIYDYMDITYVNGTRESICIGFDGWIKNEYNLAETARPVWEGSVVKRETNETSDHRRKAVIYEKSFTLSHSSGIREITLPNNPFINLYAVRFQNENE